MKQRRVQSSIKDQTERKSLYKTHVFTLTLIIAGVSQTYYKVSSIKSRSEIHTMYNSF